MLLHITYVYEAEVVAHRKRNPETRAYIDTRTVEVPEVSEADLPVAFKWKSDRSYREDAGVPREVRWTPEHGLWEERTEIERTRGSDEVTVTRFDAEWLRRQADATSEENREGWRPGSTFALYPDSHGNHDVREMVRIGDDTGIRSVRSSTADSRWGEVEAKVRGMLLMDGKVMRRAVEPVYEVSGSGSIFDRDTRRFLRIEPAPSIGSDEGLDHYRADEVEHMLASHTFHPRRDEAIQVLIPDAVRAPLPEMALMEVAKTIVERLEDKLKENDRAFFDAFADVRDTLRSFRKDVTRAHEHGEGMPDGAHLVEALQAALPACAMVSLYGGEDWVKERVDRVCERYDARSLSFSGPTP